MWGIYPHIRIPSASQVTTTKHNKAHVVYVKCIHDDVIKWKYFPRYWPFVRGIHRSPVNSPHKGQWRGALMFTLICARINVWVNNRKAGDLRRNRVHYDVIVLECTLSEERDSSNIELKRFEYIDLLKLQHRFMKTADAESTAHQICTKGSMKTSHTLQTKIHNFGDRK